MKIAVTLAPTAPEAAVRILEEAEAMPRRRHSGRRSRTRLQRVIYALGAENRVAAERLAQEYDWTGFSYGLLALSLSRNSGGAPGPEDEAEIARLLGQAYATARDEESLAHRARCAVSLFAVACEVDPDHMQSWLGETLWMTSSNEDFTDVDPILAWSLRDAEPELAYQLSFASVLTADRGDSFLDESWQIATWLDPRRTAALALRERGEGLRRAVSELRRMNAVSPLSRPTAIGFWWPRED